jgi:hypothetical protein
MKSKDQTKLESLYESILVRENEEMEQSMDKIDAMPDEAPETFNVSGDEEHKKALAEIFAKHNLPASEDAIDDILAELGLGGEHEEHDAGAEAAAAGDAEEGDLGGVPTDPSTGEGL